MGGSASLDTWTQIATVRMPHMVLLSFYNHALNSTHQVREISPTYHDVIQLPKTLNLSNVCKPITTERFRTSNGSVSALNLHVAANITETKGLKNTIPNDEEQLKGQADTVIPRLTSDPANEFFG